MKKKWRKSGDWNAGINQGVNLEDVKDDIFVFPPMEIRLSDANCSFASQVHVK